MRSLIPLAFLLAVTCLAGLWYRPDPMVAAAAYPPRPASAPATEPAAPRKPHPPPKQGEVRELQVRELGNFFYSADPNTPSTIPDDVKRLSGMKVRLRGFIVPIGQVDELTEFWLTPSLYACCFGQPPGLQHNVEVKCPSGKTVKWITDEVVVEGQLTVGEKKDSDGYITSIFQLSCTSVKPAGS